MKVRLNRRVPQTTDRLTEYELGVEAELRRRAQLFGSWGIASVDGLDVDRDEAACALTVNPFDQRTLNVSAGAVVFPNGEMVDVGSTDIQAYAINTSVTDAQLVRLEYGEVSEGQAESPYYRFIAAPKTRMKTAREMLVIETVTAYNAQPAAVRSRSVVLGVVRFTGGVLTVDNGRDTYTFSRPWFSPVDTQHRSMVGTGVKTSTNPHGLSANDLSVGGYSLAQAFAGAPAAVLARPTGYGRIPGELCEEIVPAGNFLNDATGRITGIANAKYAYLGSWPERLLSATRAADGVEVAAWIPKGRNVIAVRDPASFGSLQNLKVVFSRVLAASLPGSLLGLTSIELTDPSPDEAIIAGGNFYTVLTERKVTFTDVGLIPMAFDVLVDGTGRAYKRPDVVYCNTRLDTLGAAPVPFGIQPRAPSRLRVALSNFNPAFTEVRVQLTGTDAAGGNISEQISITGPLSAPQVGYQENHGQRRFTTNVFASVTQLQVLVRNNDGPNTTLTVFAENSPERASAQDDLLVASVFWSGAEVSATYANLPTVVLDRRLVTAGGMAGMGGVSAALNQAQVVEGILGAGVPAGVTAWTTIVEDFRDPHLVRYPQADTTLQTGPGPVELPGNSLGVRLGYTSRRIPFGGQPITFSGANSTLFLRMLPRNVTFPISVGEFQVSLTLYGTSGSQVVLPGTLTQGSPPFQVNFGAGAVSSEPFYAMSISIPRDADPLEAFRGFVFHARG